jgi:hypothetical protein
LSADSKTLQVQFYWLQQFKGPPTIPANTQPNFPDDLDGVPERVRLYNHGTDAVITSGDVITITTEDPETMPLPSMDLLEMQWILHRLAALSGGAGVFDLGSGDDDDDNESDGSLDFESEGDEMYFPCRYDECLEQPETVERPHGPKGHDA